MYLARKADHVPWCVLEADLQADRKKHDEARHGPSDDRSRAEAVCDAGKFLDMFEDLRAEDGQSGHKKSCSARG